MRTHHNGKAADMIEGSDPVAGRCAVVPGSGLAVRRINIVLWIEFFGSHAEHRTSLESPAVSNQPDPIIQHEADCRIVKLWMKSVSAPEGTRFAILGPVRPMPPPDALLGCLSDVPNTLG